MKWLCDLILFVIFLCNHKYHMKGIIFMLNSLTTLLTLMKSQNGDRTQVQLTRNFTFPIWNCVQSFSSNGFKPCMTRLLRKRSSKFSWNNKYTPCSYVFMLHNLKIHSSLLLSCTLLQSHWSGSIWSLSHWTLLLFTSRNCAWFESDRTGFRLSSAGIKQNKDKTYHQFLSNQYLAMF